MGTPSWFWNNWYGVRIFVEKSFCHGEWRAAATAWDRHLQYSIINHHPTAGAILQIVPQH